MWNPIELQNQEAWYDYYERLKKEYESVLKELGEKYNVSLDDYKWELDTLKAQLSVDEFIDIAEKKAEELWAWKDEYEALKTELIEKFEAIKKLINELTPELSSIKQELLQDPSHRSETTKKYLVQQGRLQSSRKIQQTLSKIEAWMTKILQPLGKFGDWLINIFRALLKKAWV